MRITGGSWERSESMRAGDAELMTGMQVSGFSRSESVVKMFWSPPPPAEEPPAFREFKKFWMMEEASFGAPAAADALENRRESALGQGGENLEKMRHAAT
jgi:hypothetical protein